MALDATWGGETANSYITEDDASAWVAENHIYFDEWELAKPPQRVAALLQATRNIERINWKRERYSPMQRLAFPRLPENWPTVGMRPDPALDDITARNVYLRDMKERVRAATCEQALWLLRNEGKDADREEQFVGVTGSQIGGRVGQSRGFGGTHEGLCPDAWDQLRYYRAPRQVVRV